MRYLSTGQDVFLEYRRHAAAVQKRLGQGKPRHPNEVSYLMSRSESRKTDDRIQVRCSTEVKAKLTEKAHEAGLSLSQYLIKSGLGKRIQSKGNYNALAALVKITALQKHLFNEGAGVHSKEYSEILIEVKKAAQKLQQEMDGDT